MRAAACGLALGALALFAPGAGRAIAADSETSVVLPAGVESVWSLEAAQRQSSATRERVCINGLWRWQPAAEGADAVPQAAWGYFKVPGCWPGITSYMQKDCQTLFAHPHWSGDGLAAVRAAWYQRSVTIPAQWTGRRIVLQAECVNSLAAVYVDGRRAGDIRYPAGEADLTAFCRPGATHALSLLVTAVPLEAVMLSYNNTAEARRVEGRIARRGLCGDVYLAGLPPAERIGHFRVTTSVREWQIAVTAELEDLAEAAEYVVHAKVSDESGGGVLEFDSQPFGKSELDDGRITFAHPWKPDKLWDIHTPQNQYRLTLSLSRAGGERIDESLPARFGFRELWIDGRDFYLNGTRIFLSALPIDNAQVGAAWATYEAARESIERLKSFGINFVYTHNYGCEPGSHLSFAAILQAADDAGMLVSFSQPHFAHYRWDAADADRANGYARHAAYYVQAAGNHPSVVAYSTSHNATGYAEDMNPDLIDGIHAPRSEWSARNVERALRAEAILRELDPSRIVYHHASGNLRSMHAINFYANFVPPQEMADWFEHWATAGVKPVFTCEYTVPMSWDWTLYRGWYRGERAFGSAAVPWEFCLAEWNAQFLGDRAYRISEEEKENLRWEAEQFRKGRLWHRWDYPHAVGSSDFAERYPVYAEYFARVWPALRTWGVSANSPWAHAHYWTLREGVDRGRKELPVDWQRLQRPGFSPDYLDSRYETIELAYERSDWQPTEAARTLIRYNGPLLGYIAGKPDAFTSSDHNFHAGDTVEKQLIVINNSRETAACRCAWSWEGIFGDGGDADGEMEITLPTGEQRRIPLRCELPASLAPGRYTLRARFRFGDGQTQEDAFAVDVLPRPKAPDVAARIALFDPRGETAAVLRGMGVNYESVKADADLSDYEILVIGKQALTVDGPAPQVGDAAAAPAAGKQCAARHSVSDGLKVLVFEQTPEVLEKRLGFRVATYGLRRVFPRVPDHPALAGLAEEHLRDWRGAATVVPPRLDYGQSPQFGDTPAVRWCGLSVTRLWRCGNRGSVATALIEKPARGDFLPIVDGGFALQYSPLLEYRQGRGMVLFCQMDVTARSEIDPAAEILARNLLRYVNAWQPRPRREAVYAGDPAGKADLERAGVAARDYRPGMPLAASDVLVLGSGCGQALAGDAASIAAWLAADGHLLALGCDAADLAGLLPVAVAFRRGEHIAAHFEPLGGNSPLAGIAPADVHTAAPRELPLIAGESAVGDGVLGTAAGGRAVFYQLPPHRIGSPEEIAGQHNLKRTCRRASFALARLLANLGLAAPTPLLEHLGTPPGDGREASVARNGDFSSDADGDGVPDGWLFTSESARASCKRQAMGDGGGEWSVALAAPAAEGGKRTGAMLAQLEVPMRQGQWYRIAFRARAADLESRSATLTVMNTSSWQSLFPYQQFEPGAEWQPFQFDVEAEAGAERGTRLQIWFQGSGTLELAGLRMEPIPDPAHGRWLAGLYLDVPEEWDDPYRFFRW